MIASSFSHRVFASVLAVGLAAASADAGLIHRYSFNDGTARDSVGKVDGALKGAARITDGKLVLENGEKTSTDEKLSYLEFSGSVLPKGGSVTLMVWLTGKESPAFARILDIGDKNGTEGEAFIYLTPRHDSDQTKAAITATDTGSKAFVDGPRLDDGKAHMAAIVIDGATKKLHLFIDGKETGPAADLGDNTLEAVHPVHNWIGKSAFEADPGLTASIDEFRVYNEALGADEIGVIYKAGADTLPPSAPGATGK
ncbi:MAG: LamG domain-containing protein [Planctomycetota bacterium]|nr:LamG domain-containing protein [Planctomycetota bacterium]